MNDLTRKKFDDEICRELDRLKELDIDSEEYQRVSAKVAQMTDLVNKDDESKMKLKIEKERLEAEASIEASKRGADSERLEIEQVQRQKEAKLNCWLTIATCAVSLISFIGTWVSNGISQSRSEHFEETGHAYTSRFSRFQVKEPNHPNPIVKK